MTDKKYIYFDNAASTKPYKEACDIAMKIAMEDYGNPGSLHEMGNSANLYLEKARRQILSILGDSNDRVNPYLLLVLVKATTSQFLELVIPSLLILKDSSLQQLSMIQWERSLTSWKLMDLK